MIVWPVFLSDENIDGRLLEKKFVLRSLLALFILITFLTAKLSIVTFNIGSEVASIYLQDFNKERLIRLIGDSLLWTVLMLVLEYIYSYIRNVLNKKLTISQNNTSKELDINSSHLETTDTVGAEVEEKEYKSR